jgi:2-succinyl-5-enolpyruvyl-6-hydroxy-3-cyclohexene-1-carboxylate synthase
MNKELAQHVLEETKKVGMTELCICPSARNAPLVAVCSDSRDFRTYYWPEERSAAFFALGRSKRLELPVAVITTSGSAAGELLPAVIEAYYSGIPLLLITADRPRRFRKTGAPQAIEQVGIFGVYTTFSCDLAGEERCSLQEWDRMRPLHINVCFEEPLL